MSACTTTTLTVDTSALTMAFLVSRFAESGWNLATEPKSPGFMHLAPEGDEHDWDVSPIASAPRVIESLDRRRTFAGVMFRHAARDATLSIKIVWPRSELIVLWGADCPNDPSWPRAVDAAWVMAVTRELTDALGLAPESIETGIHGL